MKCYNPTGQTPLIMKCYNHIGQCGGGYSSHYEALAPGWLYWFMIN